LIAVSRRRTLAIALPLTVALAGTVTAFRAVASHPPSSSGSAAAALAAAADELPPPERPAFVVRRPVRLSAGEAVARFAPVRQTVLARRRPDSEAAPVAHLEPQTPEHTTNVVLVIGDAAPAGWVHVRLPVLPNRLTGWVPRSALGGYQFVHTRLVVDRERLTATLYHDRRPIFFAPVGVGRPESPTPSGEFYVRDKLKGFGNPFYGPIAYGTSARSPVLTDWPGGGFVGIHGTNEPSLIPGHVSHGCIRLRNNDVLRLSRLMPVGTPIKIE
jgi:lipoprotein-anchoring transpeptidase ErfK/SrfK